MSEQYGAVDADVQFDSNHAVTLQQAESEAGLDSDPIRASKTQPIRIKQHLYIMANTMLDCEGYCGASSRFKSSSLS